MLDLLGVFHTNNIFMCLDPHLNLEWGWCCETGLSPPAKYFTDRSKAVLLLWIFYVFSVLYLLCLCVHLLVVSYGYLLGKGWPLGFRVWCKTVSLSLSHWYPGSSMVLDCIDSWSLYPYLLWDRRVFGFSLTRGIAVYLLCSTLLIWFLTSHQQILVIKGWIFPRLILS